MGNIIEGLSQIQKYYINTKSFINTTQNLSRNDERFVKQELPFLN